MTGTLPVIPIGTVTPTRDPADSTDPAMGARSEPSEAAPCQPQRVASMEALAAAPATVRTACSPGARTSGPKTTSEPCWKQRGEAGLPSTQLAPPCAEAVHQIKDQ